MSFTLSENSQLALLNIATQVLFHFMTVVVCSQLHMLSATLWNDCEP